jgi:hypothetical protein
MNSFLQKHHCFLFYSIWLILALAQAASTELINDEAYYWVYSRFPAWGYFDHPPMIALLIKWGYSVFQNELGVRLICALLSTFTILITESLTDRKNPFLFYTIVLSIGVLQIAGFLAVPDTPLLFFTAVFFYCYRLFLRNTNWQSALFLGISVALLFYTKYHGLLIVFFALLSNLKLLARWQTWLAGIFALIFFAPHLLWQWENNWVSFRYHLFESNVNAYKFSYSTEYILGQILLAGPLAGFLLLPAAFLYKTKNETEKALKFTLTGMYIFFLLSSLRGKVEANWTMPVLIPLIVLSYQFLIPKFSWINPLKIVSIISLTLTIAGRTYLVADIGPDNGVKNKFHNNKNWVRELAEKTGDKPVVFYNSYQRASQFWFYTGRPSHSLNSLGERRNNYDFWLTEDRLLGRPVYIADSYNISSFTDSVQTAKGRIGFTFDSSFSALAGVKIIPGKTKLINEKLELSFTRQMSRRYFSFLDSHRELKTELIAGIFKGKELIKEIHTGIKARELFEPKDYFLSLNLSGLSAGKYVLRFGFASKDYPPTHNSENIELRIP